MDVVEHKEFDEEVNEVVDEDEAKTVAMAIWSWSKSWVKV